MQRGRLIMFDGPDGVGKSEQVRLAAAALQAAGRTVYVTRAHGGTDIGEALRGVSLSAVQRQPLTDLLLSQTIHAELAYELTKKRAAGIDCLVDRSPLSMYAYQVAASGLDAALAVPIIKADLQTFDCTHLIVYAAPLHILQGRISARAGKSDYFESKPETYHQKVIAGYETAAELFNATIVDATGAIDEIHRATMAIVQA